MSDTCGYYCSEEHGHVDCENRGAKLALPEKLTYDDRGGYIYDDKLHAVADASPDDEGLIRMRGWGYLTGQGGLRMTDNEARTYQDRIGSRLVHCWNICAVVGLTDEELEALAAAPAEVLRAILRRPSQTSE